MRERWRATLQSRIIAAPVHHAGIATIRVRGELLSFDHESGALTKTVVVDPTQNSGEWLHRIEGGFVTVRHPKRVWAAEIVVVHGDAIARTIQTRRHIVDQVVVDSVSHALVMDQKSASAYREYSLVTGEMLRETPLAADVLRRYRDRFAVGNRHGQPGVFWLDGGAIDHEPTRGIEIANDLLLSIGEHRVKVIDLTSGGAKWEVATTSSVASIDGSDVLVFDGDHPVLRDAATGTVRWRGDAMESAAQVTWGGPYVFVATVLGMVGFRRSDGTKVFELEPCAHAQFANGRLFIGDLGYFACCEVSA